MSKPVKTFRIGSCSASVFQNDFDTKTGKRTFHSVSLQRRYQDEGGEWKNSNGFTLSDLPIAIRVLQLAQTYVEDQEAHVSQLV